MAAGVMVALLLGMQVSPDREPGSEGWRAMKRRVEYDRVRAKYLRDEEASVLKGLREIERRLEIHRDDVKALEARLAELDERLGELRGVRKASTAELEGLRARAGARAAAMHRARRMSVAGLIKRARDPIQARRMRDRFRHVLAHDRDLLRSARRADARVRNAEAGLQRDREERAAAVDALRAELDDGALLVEERRTLLAAVRVEREVAERLVRELVVASQRLEVAMSKIRGRSEPPEPAPGGFSAQRGRLPWPVSGRVEATFGKRVDPRSDIVLVANGIDIRAPLSEPIRAVFDGKVVYADRFQGFGRMLVIAHAGGYFSVYAHLERFGVGMNADVRQFQVIGFVGDSDSLKGPYLYFEVRKGSEPMDPLAWLTDESGP